ncbi:MAG: TetR/AcrR family transcriptional regulator [Chloroflexota bacterium]
MPQTRRERVRDVTREEIITTAWKQIGEVGATGLSLRGIAREMGMTAPGLYRYYKDRDALVTALLMNAFTSFTASLEAGRDTCEASDHAGRFRALCKAYFQWAAQNPQRYTLLFGTPIQGYMFAEELGPVARRSFLVLQGVIGAADTAGRISGELSTLPLPAGLQVPYAVLQNYGMPYTGTVTQLALSAWSMIHGMTSLYLYHYLTGFLQTNVEAFIDFEIEKMVRILGLK